MDGQGRSRYLAATMPATNILGTLRGISQRQNQQRINRQSNNQCQVRWLLTMYEQRQDIFATSSMAYISCVTSSRYPWLEKIRRRGFQSFSTTHTTILRRTIVCLYCKINMNSNHVDSLSYPLGQHDITNPWLEKKRVAAAYQNFYHAHFFAGFVVGTWQGTRTYIISTSHTDSLSFSCSQHDIIHCSENQIFQPRRRLIISTTSTADVVERTIIWLTNATPCFSMDSMYSWKININC